jgi:hypothetical protein
VIVGTLELDATHASCLRSADVCVTGIILLLYPGRHRTDQDHRNSFLIDLRDSILSVVEEVRIHTLSREVDIVHQEDGTQAD